MFYWIAINFPLCCLKGLVFEMEAVFHPALLSSVNSTSGSFSSLVCCVWVGVSTVIKLWCASKQPNRDLFEEVISGDLWLQTNNGTVRLWYEHKPTPILQNCKKNWTFGDLTSLHDVLRLHNLYTATCISALFWYFQWTMWNITICFVSQCHVI